MPTHARPANHDGYTDARSPFSVCILVRQRDNSVSFHLHWSVMFKVSSSVRRFVPGVLGLKDDESQSGIGRHGFCTARILCGCIRLRWVRVDGMIMCVR
jgi:hypothetical protein